MVDVSWCDLGEGKATAQPFDRKFTHTDLDRTNTHKTDNAPASAA